jgi:ferredoxin-NADP reductase
VELLSTEVCGGDLITLRFTRPEGFEYRAGQWISLSVDTPEGEAHRTLSLASAPGDPYLEVLTRVSPSTFKQALAQMRQGSAARVTGPGGRLAVPADARDVTFLAGGTGISPIRGILRDRGQRGVAFDDAILVYGNRAPDCAPFLGELQDLARIGVRTEPVYEQAPADWTGERGLITAHMLLRLGAASGPRVYVAAGPPPMVAAIGDILDDLGVPESARIVERFGAA